MQLATGLISQEQKKKKLDLRLADQKSEETFSPANFKLSLMGRGLGPSISQASKRCAKKGANVVDFSL